MWVRSTTFVGGRVEHTEMLHMCSCPGAPFEWSTLTLGTESTSALQCPSCHALVMINVGKYSPASKEEGSR